MLRSGVNTSDQVEDEFQVRLGFGEESTQSNSKLVCR